MIRFQFQKLVRDLILEILEKEGFQNVQHRRLSDKDHLQALKEKLVEEADEVISATSREELESEICTDPQKPDHFLRKN